MTKTIINVIVDKKVRGRIRIIVYKLTLLRSLTKYSTFSDSISNTMTSMIVFTVFNGIPKLFINLIVFVEY